MRRRYVSVERKEGEWIVRASGKVRHYPTRRQAVIAARTQAKAERAEMMIEGEPHPIVHSAPGKGRFTSTQIRAAVKRVLAMRESEERAKNNNGMARSLERAMQKPSRAKATR